MLLLCECKYEVVIMARPVVPRMMNKDEFIFVVNDIANGSDSWLDRLHQLTEIDKPTLQKYGTGDRPISNAHALFIRQMYLLNCSFPDLANDINVLMRQPTNGKKSMPVYDSIKEKSELKAEINSLRTSLRKIERIAEQAKSEVG